MKNFKEYWLSINILMDSVDHLKEYYEDYDGDGWVETVMDYIWSSSLVTDEQDKLIRRHMIIGKK